MNERTCHGMESEHGSDILRHPVEFKLGFNIVEYLKDLNHCSSSFWKAQG